MIHLIDSAAVLNSEGFSFTNGKDFLTGPLVVDELRDLRSRHMAENALKNGLLRLREPSKESLAKVKGLASEKGFTKLSETDFSLLALALDLKAEEKDFLLITDDFSVQNFCKLLEIKFESVIHGKIGKTISFKKRCTGCGKTFPADYLEKSCPDCSSPIESKKA